MLVFQIRTGEAGREISEIEIFLDEDGKRVLKQMIDRLGPAPSHEHLMTEDWGGVGLDSTKVDPDAEVVHHVRLVSLAR
jgi:hypothetical protein